MSDHAGFSSGLPRATTRAAAFTTWGARIAAVVAILIGGFWLSAWLGGFAARWSAAGAIIMKTNTAICQLLAGIALWLLADGRRPPLQFRRIAGAALALVVLVIGALTLSEHLLNRDLGIDQLLATEAPGAAATASPNRMGPPGSVSLALLGAGLLALAWRRRAVAQYLGLTVSVIALVPFVGFLYGIEAFFSRSRLTGIAWPTVVALFSLGLGLVLTVHDTGPMALLLREDSGGALLRRMLPAVLLGPFALGYLRTRAEALGLFDAEIGWGLFIIALMLVFALILWRSTGRLSRQAAALRESEAQAGRSRRTFVELVERSPFGTYVVDSQFRVAMMNASSQDGAFRNVRPVIGRDFSEAMRILWPEPVAAEIIGHFRYTLDTGESYYSPRFINPRHDIEIVESYEWELHRMMLPDGQFGVICYYYDSTKLREAEAAVRASEERFRVAQELSPDGFSILRPVRDSERRVQDFTWVYANAATECIVGMKLAALAGRNLLELFPGHRGSQLFEAYRQAAETGQTRVEESLYQGDSVQTQRWFRVAVVSMGQDIAVLSQDITARKQAEEALRQSREDLERAQAVGQVGSWRLDTRRNILTWSDENHRIFGLPKGTPLSYETFLSVIHPDDRQYVDTQWQAGVRGAPYDLEHRIVVADQVKWVREKAYLEFDNVGQLLGGFGITQDITARKQAENALRAAKDELEKRVVERTAELVTAGERIQAERQRLYDVLETLPAMICLLTPDHRVAFANRGFRDQFGEAHGRYCYECCFGLAQPCEFCESYEVLKTGQPHHWQVTTPDGTVIEAHDYPFTDVDGSPLILEMDLDITERKRTEAALLERSDKLRAMASELTLAEQRERQKLARVLHDGLQQVLVAGKLRLAMMERSHDLSARRVAQEVSELLSDSIETSRRLTAELSPPVLEESGLVAALEWLARWVEDKHQLTMHLEAQGPDAIVGQDIAIMLFHATRELLFNVVKHAGVKSARVQVVRADGDVRITVTDEGAGFDPAAIRNGRGVSGRFGLFSICERLGMLGGRLEIDSTPGQGSRFTLIAPLAAPPADEALARGRSHVSVILPHPDARVAEGAIRVVLVDDHVIVRQGLAGLLCAEPDIAIVGEASDGASAVTLVRRVRPDVVLMDISMPGMNGIEATRIIHAEMPDVRVVGLSMFDQADQADAMRLAGAVGYLSKSGPASALVEALRRWARASECNF